MIGYISTDTKDSLLLEMVGDTLEISVENPKEKATIKVSKKVAKNLSDLLLACAELMERDEIGYTLFMKERLAMCKKASQ